MSNNNNIKFNFEKGGADMPNNKNTKFSFENGLRELLGTGSPVMMGTIDVSGEKVNVQIYINKQGNIVIGGVENVTYEMIGEELILRKYEG